MTLICHKGSRVKVFAVAIFMLAVSDFPAGAYTMTTAPAQSSRLVSTGLFGGVTGSKFKLIRSEQGGLLYFRITSQLTVAYQNKQISISKLPLTTPITVTTENGLVISVEVAGGSK